MKNFFTLLFSIFLALSLSHARAQVLTGHLMNADSVSHTIYAYGMPDSTFYATTQSDVSGDFTMDFSTWTTGYVNCSFFNCVGDLVDTIFSLNSFFPPVWYVDYCDTTGGGSGGGGGGGTTFGGNCNVSFTTAYDQYTNTFSLFIDTSGLSGGNYVAWSFGDGTYSTDWFPTHQYNANSLFTVCVMISGTDSCWYCHELGFDSLGNVVLKPTEIGFTLQVHSKTTGINELPEVSGMSLYPNPAGDFAILHFSSSVNETMEITITNSIGQQIRHFKQDATEGLNELKMDLHDLSSGAYVVSVKSSKEQLNSILVK